MAPNGTNNSRTFNPSTGSAEKRGEKQRFDAAGCLHTGLPSQVGGFPLRQRCLDYLGRVTRGQLTTVADSGLTADGAVCLARQVDDKKTNPGLWRGGWTAITTNIALSCPKHAQLLLLLPPPPPLLLPAALRGLCCVPGRGRGKGSADCVGSSHAETHAETCETVLLSPDFRYYRQYAGY